MQKLKFVIFLLIFISCSSDDDTPPETFFNPHDLNSAKINFDGIQIPNDSIPSVFVSTSFCCNDVINIDLSMSQPEYNRGHVLSLKLSSEGEILKYHTQNDFLDPSTDLHFSPYFYIPEDFYEIEQFDFNFEEERLDLKANVKLLKEKTYFDEGEVIEVDAEIEVRYFTPCNCSTAGEKQKMRKLELLPDIKFTDFSIGRIGFDYNFYTSTDTSSGYYFELANLSSSIKDYPLGVYTFGEDETTPDLIFKKFVGPPHAFSKRFHFDNEWIDYKIEGQFEIIEKLDNNLTRSKLTFTASLDGEIVYEFTDIEMIL